MKDMSTPCSFVPCFLACPGSSQVRPSIVGAGVVPLGLAPALVAPDCWWNQECLNGEELLQMSDPSVGGRFIAPLNASTMEKKSSTNRREELLSTRPWLCHYEEGVPAELTIPDVPLTWLLERTVSRYPGNTALIYYGTKLSYAQLSSLANRFAAGLQRLGVKKGDRVAIALPNIPQYSIAFYGALRAGAVIVPTNPLYTEREMQHQLADSEARVLIMLDIFYPIVRAIRTNTSLEYIIITSAADFLPPMLRKLYPVESRFIELVRRNAKHPEPHLTEQELSKDPILDTMSSMLQSHTK